MVQKSSKETTAGASGHLQPFDFFHFGSPAAMACFSIWQMGWVSRAGIGAAVCFFFWEKVQGPSLMSCSFHKGHAGNQVWEHLSKESWKLLKRNNSREFEAFE